MRLNRYWTAVAFFLLLAGAVVVIHTLADNENTTQAARDVVHAFLQSEFKGEVLDERKQLITFSAKRLADIERDEPGPGPGPYMLYMSSRPVFVVSAAEIVSVKVDGNRATAVVSYRRLARIDNFGTEKLTVLPSKKDSDPVTLNLVFAKEKWFDKKKWWILDPPPPRVSKQAMVEHYEYQVQQIGPGSVWHEYWVKQPVGPWAYHERLRILNFLKSLP